MSEFWVIQGGSESHRHPRNAVSRNGETSQPLAIHGGPWGGTVPVGQHAGSAGQAFCQVYPVILSLFKV